MKSHPTNWHEDVFFGIHYDLHAKATDQPIITQQCIGAGSIVAIHCPIFKSYFLAHYSSLRQFIAKLDIHRVIVIA